MRRVTFSRNFTLSLSRTCQCYCKYCAFATHRPHLHAPDEVERMLDDAARRGCKELLVLTGAAVNPARWFGPALVSGEWNVPLLYIFAPIVGAVLAALMYWYLFVEGPSPREARPEAGPRGLDPNPPR